jgi:small conductance mechanosensitive channel
MLMQNSNTTLVLDNATQITDVVWQSINNLITSIVERLPYLIAGALVLLLFWLLSSVVKKVFWTVTKRTKLDERLRILFSRLIVVFVFVLGIFTALTVVVPSFAFGDFIAGLGLTSLAIGFATKDILNHLISGVLILWQQPFRIGDYLIMKDDQGWVEYIGVRATSLRKSNGEVILIPNGDIYSSPLKIRRSGASYPMSLKFTIGYNSDVEETKRITRSTLLESNSIVSEPPPKVVITDLESDGICVTANFRINSNENRPLEVFDEAASRVLDVLSDARIEIFPPTSTILQQPKDELNSTKDADYTGRAEM